PAARSQELDRAGANPQSPPKIHGRWKPCFETVRYRGRTAIKSMFGRRKECRRSAARYDRSATSYLAAVCIGATFS
ncbi:IS5/IS1182 family transposase, partial [Methylobacterium sp. J-030]|nr:IS5/IS1182 family transposase [Methylobacterium sp. J-030]